jgi:TorA maturation chaperone TorD
MILELSGKYKVLEIKKKTSAVFFKELKVGDEFELIYNLNGGYESAPWISIYQDGARVHGNNANQLEKNLVKFEIEQIS